MVSAPDRRADGHPGRFLPHVLTDLSAPASSSDSRADRRLPARVSGHGDRPAPDRRRRRGARRPASLRPARRPMPQGRPLCGPRCLHRGDRRDASRAGPPSCPTSWPMGSRSGAGWRTSAHPEGADRPCLKHEAGRYSYRHGMSLAGLRPASRTRHRVLGRPGSRRCCAQGSSCLRCGRRASAACAPAAGAPTWTFRPAAQTARDRLPRPAGPVPATGHVLGTLEVTAVDLGFKPTDLSVDKAGRYEVKLTNTGAIPHDITFAGRHEDRGRGREATDRQVQVPAERSLLHLLDPRPRRRRDEGHDHGRRQHGGRRGRRRPRRPGPGDRRPAGPQRPAVHALRRRRRRRCLPATTHDIDLVIEEKLMTVAARLRPGRLDLRRHGPGPRHPGQVGDTIRIHLKNPATSKLAHSRRLPRQPGRLERRDDLDQPRRGEALRVEGRLRRRLDVPLRHGARRCTTSPTACTGW